MKDKAIKIIKDCFNVLLSQEKVLLIDNATKNIVFKFEIDNQKYVLKINPSNNDGLKGVLFWNNYFKKFSLDKQVNIVYYSVDVDNCWVMMKLEEGKDLNFVFNELNFVDKEVIAKEIISIQKKIATLVKFNRFGFFYGLYKEGVDTKDNWSDFLICCIDFFIKRLNNKYYDLSLRVKQEFETNKELLDDIKPQAFLWDVAGKNVMIENKKLNAIVDVEEVCYGDFLFYVGLVFVVFKEKWNDDEYYLFFLKNINDFNEKRFSLYKIFFSFWFLSMSKIAINGENICFDDDLLLNIINQNL